MTYVFHSILACFLSSSILSVSLKTRIDNMSLEYVLKSKRCPFDTDSLRVICVVYVFLCSVNVTSILQSQKITTKTIPLQKTITANTKTAQVISTPFPLLLF